MVDWWPAPGNRQSTTSHVSQRLLRSTAYCSEILNSRSKMPCRPTRVRLMSAGPCQQQSRPQPVRARRRGRPNTLTKLHFRSKTRTKAGTTRPNSRHKIRQGGMRVRVVRACVRRAPSRPTRVRLMSFSRQGSQSLLHTHTHTRTRTRTRTHTHVHTHAHAKCVRTRAPENAQHTHTHIHTHTTSARTACTHAMRAHARTRAEMRATHAHTHTHVHNTHTQNACARTRARKCATHAHTHTYTRTQNACARTRAPENDRSRSWSQWLLSTMTGAGGVD